MSAAPPSELLEVPIHDLQPEEFCARVLALARGPTAQVVPYANVHMLNLCAELPWMKALYQEAPLVFCDGQGVRLGLWLMGRRVPPRINLPDQAPALFGALAATSIRVFLLGGRPEEGPRAAARLRQLAPGIELAGTHPGYFDLTDPETGAAVVETINASGAELVLVSLGALHQEAWVREHRARFRAGCLLLSGALVSNLAGTVRLAPRVVGRWGLEWAWRLVLEPRRLARRYLLGLPLFFLRLAWRRAHLPGAPPLRVSRPEAEATPPGPAP